MLNRGGNDEIAEAEAEAEAAIARLAAAPGDDGLVIPEVWLLRLRALLARAHGDDASYRELRDRYRAMATSLGHLAFSTINPLNHRDVAVPPRDVGGCSARGEMR